MEQQSRVHSCHGRFLRGAGKHLAVPLPGRRERRGRFPACLRGVRDPHRHPVDDRRDHPGPQGAAHAHRGNATADGVEDQSVEPDWLVRDRLGGVDHVVLHHDHRVDDGLLRHAPGRRRHGAVAGRDACHIRHLHRQPRAGSRLHAARHAAHRVRGEPGGGKGRRTIRQVPHADAGPDPVGAGGAGDDASGRRRRAWPGTLRPTSRP